MKQIIIMVVATMMATINVTAQNNKDTVQVYIPIEHLPRLVEIMPAPPAFDSPEFASDVVRYCWGKQQRRDSARVAMAIADAEWERDARDMETGGDKSCHYRPHAQGAKGCPPTSAPL